MALIRLTGLMVCGLLAANGESAGDGATGAAPASDATGSTQVVQLGPVTEYALYHGRVETSKIVDISAPVGGQLEFSGVAYGDKIMEGQELFIIESEELAQEAFGVERAYNDARWWLESYYPSAAKTVELGLTNIRLRGDRELDRSAAATAALQRAVDENIISKDEQLAQARKHDEALASHHAVLAEAELKLVELERARREHQDRLDTLELRLASLREAADRTQVRAPFDGRVVGILPEAALVGAGAYIMTLASAADAMATFLVSDAELSSFLDARGLVCEIKRLSVTVDCEVASVVRPPGSGEYAVGIRISRPPPALTAGDIVAIRKIVAQKESAVVVPLSSLASRDGVAGVYVAVPSGRVFRPVQLGVRGVDSVEVVVGVSANEVVFTRAEAP